MDYEDFLPNYPDVDDPKLQQKILNKKEFFELRLQRLTRQVERVPEDHLQRHQRLIQRFLSVQTPFDELLVYHETGTGKTRAAFAATEQVLLGETRDFRRVIFLAKGDDQLENALIELVSYARQTARFRDFQPTEEVSVEKQIRRALSGTYLFQTWATFSGKRGLSRMDDAQMLAEYNNTIFIVDEVHNIRGQRDPSQTYTQLHRLFHVLKNRKVILMSGTPMRDQVSELADVMNLILPLDRQLPIVDAFTQRYVHPTTNEIVNAEELKTFIRGRVSFLRAVPDEGVQKVYLGEFLSPDLPVQQFKYVATQMREEQLLGYERAYQMDTGEESDASGASGDGDQIASFYSNARQASLFVFPDGSFGREGYERFVKSRPWLDLVYPLENLQKYSCKYAYVVEQLLRPELQNQSTYVYSSLVDGSGLGFFAQILEKYGFSKCTGKETQPGLRYMLLTSATKLTPGHSKDIPKLIQYFNHERNIRGEYCRVILGSRIISEGFTFKNVRHIHILTLHWNYTETQQAIARAIRFGSHRMLVDQPSVAIPVYIYQHVAENPEMQEPSIDLQMLTVSQRKDIVIRRVTRLIKEISFDCPLVYERNLPEERSPRECDYSLQCAYPCSQLEAGRNPIDLNTYRLYYQEGSDFDVWTAVCRFFSDTSSLPIHLYAIQDQLQIDLFQLVRVLSDLIRHNTPIVNAYGVECFLREDHNEYFLVDNLLLPNGQKHLSWYTRNPTVLQKQSLAQLIRRKGFRVYEQRIETLRAGYAQEILDSLPASLRELYKTLQQEQLQEGVRTEQDIFRDARARGIPYYGTVDQNQKFRIVDIQSGVGVQDVRKMKSGSDCLGPGFNKDRIVLVFFSLGIPLDIPESYLSLFPDPEAQLLNMKDGPELLVHPELNLATLKESDAEAYTQSLYRIIHILKTNKKELCSTIREWMRANGLLSLIQSEVKGVRKLKLKDIRV